MYYKAVRQVMDKIAWPNGMIHGVTVDGKSLVIYKDNIMAIATPENLPYISQIVSNAMFQGRQVNPALTLEVHPHAPQ